MTSDHPLIKMTVLEWPAFVDDYLQSTLPRAGWRMQGGKAGEGWQG